MAAKWPDSSCTGFAALDSKARRRFTLPTLAAFAIIALVVAHRLLRFDLLSSDLVALRPQAILLTLLALSVPLALWRRQLHLRFSTVLAVQWSLFGWAMLSRVVSDGVDEVLPFLLGDYAKDLAFATVLGVLTTNPRRLRVMFATMVLAILFAAAIAIPQRFGPKQCHYFRFASLLNYEQTSDGRPCQSTAECYTVPRHEQHLRDYGWACERTGPLGLATVIDRIHYTGSMLDPNALALTLVMAAALLLGLAAWPSASPMRWLWLLGLPVLGLAVILAASRAAQVAMGAVFLIFFYFRVGIGGAVLAAVMASPVLLISTRNEAVAAYSKVTRIMTYLNGFRAFLDHPLFGVGFANYERISFLNAHNSFLQALVESGAIGGTLYLSGVYVAAKLLILVLRFPSSELTAIGPARLEEIQHIAKTLLAMLVGVFLCVLFLSLAFDFSWLLPLGLVAGFELSLRDEFPTHRLRLGWLEILAMLLCTLLFLGLFVLVSAR